MSATVETVYRTSAACEASCALLLEIDREAEQVLQIKGDSKDVHSLGYVCARSLMPGLSANELVDDEVLDLLSGSSVVNGVPLTIRAIQL